MISATENYRNFAMSFVLSDYEKSGLWGHTLHQNKVTLLQFRKDQFSIVLINARQCIKSNHFNRETMGTDTQTEEEFRPKGALAFFVVLLLFFVVVYFSVYFQMFSWS